MRLARQGDRRGQREIPFLRPRGPHPPRLVHPCLRQVQVAAVQVEVDAASRERGGEAHSQLVHPSGPQLLHETEGGGARVTHAVRARGRGRDGARPIRPIRGVGPVVPLLVIVFVLVVIVMIVIIIVVVDVVVVLTPPTLSHNTHSVGDSQTLVTVSGGTTSPALFLSFFLPLSPPLLLVLPVIQL